MSPRKMSWPLALLVGLAGIVAVEFVIVEVWIGDGLDGLTREERTGAQELINQASVTCLDNPIERGLTRKIRVVEVTFVPRCKQITPYGLFQGYRVVLQAYTLFGIPLVRIIGCCNGSVVCSRPGPLSPDPCSLC